MPYKCVHCDRVIGDGDQELLKGCSSCQSKFFFYIRKEKLQEMQRQAKVAEVELNTVEKEQVEQDVREILGADDEETPVFLDFESIKILKPGKYLLDVSKMLESDRPQVYQLEDGKYVVDLGHLTSRKD
ncbi:hypothetical protein CMI48_00925 [Candidatus Pacearchaeota archaeon]|nr:hypothetical protein [Candidatus Pacearchaeota archaeon]